MINDERRRIAIGNHVWIGRLTMSLPDVKIVKVAILAAGAILTSDMAANTVFASVPAWTIHNDIKWFRATAGF